MAEDVQVKLEPETSNSCCASWKNKYSKLEEKRNALRQAVKLLELQIDKIQTESKKVREEERARADLEREGKEKESAARQSLENEIAALKSEVLSLKEKGCKDFQDGNGELKLLQARVSEGENEINRLKEVIQKERKKADSERKVAEAEKKKAAEAVKIVENERTKAEKERGVGKHEKERAEKFRLQIEVLKKEVDEAKSKLAFETVRVEEANKKLEAEKQKAVKEKKRADLERAKADEQRKLAEANKKRVVEGKNYAESLSQQLEETKIRAEGLQKEIHELKSSRNLCNDVNIEDGKLSVREAYDTKLVLELSLKFEEANRRFQLEKERADRETLKAEKQKKLAEVNWKKAAEEKSHADQLYKQLEEEKKKIGKLQKKIRKLCSSRKSVEPSAVSMAQSMELKFLKKQLKFEKMKKNHAKEVAELERSRNSILQQELGRLKVEFDQFSCRLGLLHKSFSHRAEGADGLEKTGNMINMRSSDMKNLCGSESFQNYLQSHNELLKPSCPAMKTSVQQTLQHTAHLCPVPGGNCVEHITGIDSKLESLVGGSTRTMLKSSAINSSTTSFSDGQLVGSQDKGAFSVTTSENLVEEHVQPTLSDLSGEVTKMRSGENLAVVAENSVRSPVNSGDVGRVTVHSRKRKRILDTVETIENLYYEDKKLHLQVEEKLAVLHGMLNKQMDMPCREGNLLLPSLHGSSHTKHDKHDNKKKTSFQEEVVKQHACDSIEREKRDVVETEVHGNTNFCRQASLTGIDQIGTFGANGEGLNNSVKSDFEALAGFGELVDGDYMNLLNLDDVADEECYRMAMEKPLSPTLPEIEVQCVEIIDGDNTIPLVNETLCEGLSNKDNKLLPFVDIIDAEISFNKSKCGGSTTLTNSLMHKDERDVNSLGIPGNDRHTSILEKPSGFLGVEVEMTNPSISRDEKSRIPFEGELGSTSNSILEQCVIFSNINDGSSFSRIYHAIRTCIAQCSLATQTGWMMREILLALKKEEKLLAKEKVCTLFSLLMINFSVTAFGKFGNFLNWASIPCLDSFAEHVLSVMSHVEIRSLFAELGCLDELLSLIENFLIDGCLKVFRDISFGSTVECDSRVSILLDGSNIKLSVVQASTEQFVAGSIILASICAALDRIGFICETSYSILQAHRFSNSLMLTILHIFAYLGGDKFFNLSDYSLMMTVLKFIVRNLEGLSQSGSSVTCIPQMSEAQSAFCPSDKCPFLGDVMSVDLVTSLLLEKLKTCEKLVTVPPNVTEPVYRASEMNFDGTCCLNKNDTFGNQSDAFTTVTLSSLSDILALVELVARYVGWEWTRFKIVPQLLKLLESCVFENLTSGVVILLGQLGRLGIEAFGYEDGGVEQLRSDLSAFLGRGITMKTGLPIQIATVSALLGLLSVDFETIIQTNEKLPAIDSESVPGDMMRKWFSLLSKKQQDLSVRVLQSGGVNKE